MRITEEEYFDPGTPEGVPVRYLHKGCSDGKDPSLVVTRTSTGWKYRCHRCRSAGYRGLDGFSASVVASFAKQTWQKKGLVRQITLPQQYRFSDSIETALQAWLMRYDITPAEFARYGMYRSYAGRLIIPVKDSAGKVVYWQGRSFVEEQAKWVNQKQVGREDVFFRANPEPSTEGVVLVEDIISAIKVNRVMDAVALLGSYVPDTLVLDLSRQYQVVYLWLDADKSQYSLSKTNRFQSFGLQVKRISTPEDPKYYSEDKILGFIQGG